MNLNVWVCYDFTRASTLASATSTYVAKTQEEYPFLEHNRSKIHRKAVSWEYYLTLENRITYFFKMNVRSNLI
ncbi:unnamed protein product [Allacma fusca]|uniref:Uncharacterized protein n=1 Tax=Allacma fusca TaxID=39272 RepID=A0A8J2KFD1_9HEXA|nr:unnamed protein product [Allacma fusca]